MSWVTGERGVRCLGFFLKFAVLDAVASVVESVVVAAEEYEVFEFGFAAVGPVDAVVNVAPRGPASAARVLALSVPRNYCSAQGRWDDSGFAADVEDFGFRSEHDPGQRRVTRQLSDGRNA